MKIDELCQNSGCPVLFSRVRWHENVPPYAPTVRSAQRLLASFPFALLRAFGWGGMGLGIIHALINRGSIPWIADGLGKLDLRQTLHETITLEFGIGHDDLPWGSAWLICRKAWDMVKYLIGSMNSSYDSLIPTKRGG